MVHLSAHMNKKLNYLLNTLKHNSLTEKGFLDVLFLYNIPSPPSGHLQRTSCDVTATWNVLRNVSACVVRVVHQ